MKKRILRELDTIEQTRRVRIMYACESGSRAWGFASKDSDYDVRFIYAHPNDWYLSITEKPDVIEIPVDEELNLLNTKTPKNPEKIPIKDFDSAFKDILEQINKKHRATA